jgi:hypothetical protein
VQCVRVAQKSTTSARARGRGGRAAAAGARAVFSLVVLRGPDTLMGDAAAAARVARQYSDRQGQTNEERRHSDINKLRELNNWVRCATR